MEAVSSVTDGNSGAVAPSAGPSTFAEAFAGEASSASTPSDQSTTPPAAEQPGTVSEASPQQTEDRSPFIPRPRFDEVNTERNTLKEWKERHAWAEQVDPQEFAQIQQIARHFANGDKLAGIKALLAEARTDPAIDAQLRSMHAQALAMARQAPQAPQEPQPDLPIQLEDGRVVHLYSAEQQAKREAWLQQQWMQGVEQKLQPLQQTHETLQAERQALAQQQEMHAFTTRTFESATKWKGMDDPAFRAKVATRLQQASVNGNDPRDVTLALHDAYLAVRDSEDQTLTHKAQSALLDTLKTKAAASSSVNPGAASATASRAYTSFKDLPPEAWR